MTVAELRALLDKFDDADMIYINVDRETPAPRWTDKRHETMFLVRRRFGDMMFMTEEKLMSDKGGIACGVVEVIEKGLLLWTT